MTKIVPFLLLCWSFWTEAALEEVIKFHFGDIAVTSTAVVSTVTVPLSGPSWSDGAIHIIKPGQAGLYRLTEFVPFRYINITPMMPQVSDPITTSDGFELVSVDMPSQLSTDSNGTAMLPIGGVLRTRTTTGEGYFNTTYHIYLTITIEYE
ncbi:MAG: DUF4402 domain-containing protein [Gammaproteobacteria bacterium]|nr:DUF4402 domain-containing protein [Gammaproteobacteria bacterium]